MESPGATPQRGANYDDVSELLNALRARQGHISYAKIVERMTAARRALDDSSWPPARSTVYDAFRSGRRRVDAFLVLEIANALSATEEDIAEIKRHLDRGREQTPAARGSVVVSLPDQAGGSSQTRRVAFLLAASVLMNVGGHALVAHFGLPLFLDMIGTAVTALALGPWWGVGVAVVTQVAGAAVNSPDAIPFVLVNVAGALVWGYGARRLGMAQTPARLLALSAIVACVCAAVAVPIIITMFGGVTGHSADAMTVTLTAGGLPPAAAVVGSDLITSLMDKLVTGFVALVVVYRFPIERK